MPRCCKQLGFGSMRRMMESFPNRTNRLRGRIRLQRYLGYLSELGRSEPAFVIALDDKRDCLIRVNRKRIGSAMATELRRLGQSVEESEDRLRITPNLNKLKSLAVDGVEIDTYKDHRFAMSFGVLGSCDLLGNGRSWMKINDPIVVRKHIRPILTN